MSRLGERLVQEGRLGQEPLRRALALQKQLGGRLGTQLLEIGAVPEDTLLQALGAQRSTRTASAEQLRRVPPELLRLIPARLARRYEIVPFERQGNTLLIAAMDAGDVLVEDEVRMLSGCMVRTHLALELRIREALGRYYQAQVDVRVSALVRRLASAHGARPSASAPPSTIEPSPAPSTATGSWNLGPPPVAPKVPDVPELPPLSSSSASFSPSPVARSESGRGAPAPPAEAPAVSWEPPPELPPVSSPAPATAAAPAPTAESPAALAPAQRPRDSAVDLPALTYIEIDEAEEAALRRQHDAGAGEAELAAPAEVPPPERIPAAEPPETTTPQASVAPPAEAATAEPPEAPVEERLAVVAEALQGAVIRDDIADAILDFCAPYLRRRALLIHRSDRILGWRGEGPGVDEPALRQLEISPRDPSVFLSLSHAASFWLGPLPSLPANQALLGCLGTSPPKDCLVLPVMVRSKIVCSLYGDNLGAGVATVPLAECKRLLAKTALAFEVYILKNKIRLL